MAATVYDGSLQFTAGIDDSGLSAGANKVVQELKVIQKAAQDSNEAMAAASQKQVQAAIAASEGVNDLKAALETITQANQDAFNAGNIDAYASQINEAAKAILQMVAATGQNFGADKLQALNEALKNVSTDGEQLQTIFAFLKKNIADLKLTPADTDAFLAKMQDLSGVLSTLQEKSEDLGPVVAQTFKSDSGFLEDHINSIKDLEAQLDRLIEREALLKRAIDNTNDPAALQGYQNGLKETESQMNAIGERLDELNTQKLTQSVDDTGKSTANLLTQLRELRYSIANTMEQFGSGSPEVNKLIVQAAELEQRLKNADKQVALFASNTAGLDALKQGFNGLVGGVTSLLAATSLLSGDNDALQQTMVKLFAVMQVVNGAEQLFSVLNKNSAVSVYLKGIAVKISTASTQENTAATTANTVSKETNTAANIANAGSLEADAAGAEAATGATEGLTGAVSALAIPLGIVALVLAEIVGIYEIFQQRAKDAALAQELLNSKIENAAKNSQRNVADIKAQGDIAVAQLKATGAAQSAIRDQELRQLDQINDINQRDLNAATQNLQRLQNQLAQKYNAQVVNGALVGGKSLSKEDQANYQKANQLFLQAQQQAQQASTALQVQQLADQQQLTQEGLQNYSASLAARIAKLKATGDQQKALEVQKDKNISDARAQAWGKDAQIQNQIYAEAAEKNVEIDRQLADLQIDNATALAQKKLALAKQGSLDEYAAKAQLIELNAQKEINAAKGNQIRINAIKAQANKAQDDLTDQTNAEEIAREKGAAVAGINARLEAVQKGSEQELDLQLDLINQKQRYDLANVQFTIKNEEARQTAITNINTKALQDREKAEKDYYDNLYNLQIQSVKASTAQASLPFQNAQNNPLSTNYQKDQSAINETLVRQAGLQKELEIRITEYTSAVSRGEKNLAGYEKKIDDINLALQVLNGLLGNQKNQAAIDHATEVSGNLQSVAQGFSTLASNIQSLNPGLAQMAQTLSTLAGEASNVYLAFSKTLTKTEGYQIAIQGTVSLIGMMITAQAQRHQAESEFNADLLAQQDEYNKALNQSILLNYQLKDNVFVTDYQEQITDGVAALSDATDKYQDALKQLANIQVTTGKRDAINWNNVLGGAGTGAAAGAALGSVVPVIGTAIGGVVGGIVGGIVGLLSKKSKDILAPILNEYPELIDKTKQGVDQFNDALAQSLIDSKLVKGQSEEVLASLVQWKQAVEAANQQIEDAVSTLAGQLGDNLRDSLVQAFEDGTDAGQAFAQSVGDSLESVLKQLLFNAVFGDALKDLQDKLTNTLENGGDVTDVYTKFFQTYSGLSKQFSDDLQQLQNQAKANGLDIFQSSSNNNNPNTLAGAIKAGITEDTATLLAGQFNAMRLEEIAQTELAKLANNSLSKMTDLMTQNLMQIVKIETNTGLTAKYTANLIDMKASLKSIDGKISDFDAVKKANGIH